MNLLIIEDEQPIALMIKNLFEKTKAFHSIEVCFSFEEAIRKGKSGIFDVIITDISLEKNDQKGLIICETLKKESPQSAIIVVTSYQDIQILEEAFEKGANDYVTKPFHPKELTIRVLKWVQRFQQEWSSLEYHELKFHEKTREVSWKGKKISLSKRSKDLLLIFLKRPESLISTKKMEELYWGDLERNSSRNIRSNIHNLRKQLGPHCEKWIHTVPSEGYLLKKPRKQKDSNLTSLQNEQSPHSRRRRSHRKNLHKETRKRGF